MDKDRIKQLMNVLWEKYPYASIMAACAEGKNYSVSAAGTVASQSPLLCQNGYVVRAYKPFAKDKGRYAEYSFNELDDGALVEIPQILEKLFESMDESKWIKYDTVAEEEFVSFTENEFHDNPEEIGDKAIISKLSQIRSKGLSMDERILDCRVNSSYQIYTKYFLSPKKEASEKVLWMTGYVFMLAKKGEAVKSYFASFSNRDGAAVLDCMDNKLEDVAKATVELLNAEQITPGEYECICAPDVTGMIVHEAFGHGVEMDMFVKDRALAKEYIGEYVASPLVTMHDGAAAAVETATYDFDDEGERGQDTVIIEKGILKRGICDARTAACLGIKSTGNGRRENYERKAYTRMTNTFFEGGTDKVEDMIASIKKGFYLENATCGMEDPKNWGIQCMVNVAREIVDGKFTGKIYSPVVLSGYVPDLLKSISMMSEEAKLCGSGFCGKGYKEWVKVSDGGPFIKATIKLG